MIVIPGGAGLFVACEEQYGVLAPVRWVVQAPVVGTGHCSSKKDISSILASRQPVATASSGPASWPQVAVKRSAMRRRMLRDLDVIEVACS